MKAIASFTLAAVSFLAAAPRATADGIFADINTSLGGFSAELHYAAAPQTVGNFISLAEGSRAWVNPNTGAVYAGKPFYNGLIFHRVISGFMNQGGCPLGNGSSGPGYEFRDELADGMLHDVPYRLSMANSGRNTNGSQFFVTVPPTPHLNGKHTVFGTVVQGQAVVDAINAVPTSGSPDDRPVTPVVIQSVTIRREGAAAQAFDVNAQGLPVCTGSRGRLAVERNVASRWLLDAPLPPGSTLTSYQSANLQTWKVLDETYRGPGEAPVALMNLTEAKAPSEFYHLSQVSYPGAGGSSNNANRVLTVVVVDGEVLTFTFDASGAAGNGHYAYPDGSKSFTFTLSGDYSRPYENRWALETTELGKLRVDAALDTETATHFSGRRKLYQWNIYFWQEINSTHSFTLTK